MKKLVLLIDDEDIIRMTSGEILEELGLDVITAATGNEGLEVFKSKSSDISLVILDLTLPDMPGMEVFNEMRKTPSGVKYLLTSGYSQDMAEIGKDASFIQKPYTMTELNKRLVDLLGEI
jgi:DNA-binding response OmpR family regulator